MRIAVVIGCLLVAGYVADLLMLAAERRNWVYWRRHKPSSGSATAAALAPLHALTQPSYEYVVAARDREHVLVERAEEGEPPEPGADPGTGAGSGAGGTH